MNTTINIILFGIGNVGSTLIKQVLATADTISLKQGYKLEIPIIANSTTAFFKPNGIKNNWQTDFNVFGFPYKIGDILTYIKRENLTNVIIVDATASRKFVKNYKGFSQQGYHIVTANKIANTLSLDYYNSLRATLLTNGTHFNYETNVGAGLPIVETLRQLSESGEQLYKIRGVFSGSLSYILNTFSEASNTFSSVLKSAENKGFTEPDVREDLSGKDVARKLLILAREIGLQKELSDISVESLLPSGLCEVHHLEDFNLKLNELDAYYSDLKTKKLDTDVFRYIGELDVLKGTLQTKLVLEPKTSAIGQLKGADAAIEIYSESYKEQPLVIQGAGAGSAVTARGVLTDVLKIAKQLNTFNLVEA
jgi:homoserine dehydrogenase